MVFKIFNLICFLVLMSVTAASLLFLIGEKKQSFLRIVFLSVLTVFPGYFAWTCLKNVIFNETAYLYQTKVRIKRELNGEDRPSTAGIAAISSVYKTTGFKLDSIDVNNIWSGNIKTNNKILPLNLYEVNTTWRNPKKGRTEKNCFILSWADNRESGYFKETTSFNDCKNKQAVIKKISEDEGAK